MLPREAVQVARREGLYPCRPNAQEGLTCHHVKQCQTRGQRSTTHGSHLQPDQLQRCLGRPFATLSLGDTPPSFPDLTPPPKQLAQFNG